METPAPPLSISRSALSSSFWLLLIGNGVAAAAEGMIWPFLAIHLRERFAFSLTAATTLLTVTSLLGIALTSITGAVIDHYGSKRIIVGCLGAISVAFLLMGCVSAAACWAAIIFVAGACGRPRRVGIDALIAAWTSPEQRSRAYALSSVAYNVGSGLGPLLGGVMMARSYEATLYFASGVAGLVTILLLLVLREPPPAPGPAAVEPAKEGYAEVLRDHSFIIFCGVYSLSIVAYSLMMGLLPAYLKYSRGFSERDIGLVNAVNAVLVIALQSRPLFADGRRHPLAMMAAGSLFYALGLGSVAAGRGFIWYGGSMVALTCGEIVLFPRSVALTANLAPPRLRGRYLSVLGLTSEGGAALGPAVGGLLNDHVAPNAVWYGGLAIGLGAAAGFWALLRCVRLPVHPWAERS